MSVDVTFDPVVPNSANPEQAVNTALSKVANAVLALEALIDPDAGSGVPTDGEVGQYLKLLADGTAWADLPPFPPGLPSGGVEGQLLARLANGVAGWVNPPAGGGGGDGDELPAGGSVGQFLARIAGGGVGWVNPPTGGGGTTHGSHKYWRVVIRGSTGDIRYVYLAELAFLTGLNQTVQPGPGVSFTNGFYSTNNDANAFDGNPATVWESIDRTNLATNPAILGYNFNSPQEITAVKLSVTSYENDEYPTALDVQYSDDNATWITAKEVPSVTFVAPVGSDPSSVLIDISKASSGGGEGDTIYAACILYINDTDGTVDTTKTKKNNIGTIERLEAGRWRFNFATPLPDLDCHLSVNAIYGSFDDRWRSRVEVGRAPADRWDLNHITFWTPNQDNQLFDPIRLEFRLIKFR